MPGVIAFPLSYTVRRSYVDAFLERAVSLLPAGATVLDLGGHKTRKRGRFNIADYACDVVYANISQEKGVDLVADGNDLPFAPAAFDAVLCAELLEHVPDPRRVLAQLRPLIRPGGTLLITAPFLYRVHADPHDYGRYTATWWRRALEQAGFTVMEVEEQGRYFGVLVEFIGQAADRFGVRPLRFVLEPALALLKQGAVWLDALPGVKSDPFFASFTTGYGIVARAGVPSPP